MKKLLVLFLLSLAPLAAADANVTLTLDNAYLPSFRAYLLAAYPAADTDESGAVSNAEIVAWMEDRAQNMLQTFAQRGVEWAEANDPTTLPAAHRTALTAKQAADAALTTERDKIAP
jgi:hypothetical protein